MKKIISLMLLGLILSGCFLRPHKTDIEQGNIIDQKDVSKLHRGMTESQVKEVMGQPVLVNIFSTTRIDYIYTFQEGYGVRTVNRVTCIFENGRLRDIQR
jgi:outer membrane protein assembly factor BamE